jgi:hypothetical protein
MKLDAIPDLQHVLKYLKDKEWSMGNGQCPECCGVPESWHGHPGNLTPETIGHNPDCVMAQMLRDLGETPLMKGDFSGPDYETYWTDDGFLAE